MEYSQYYTSSSTATGTWANNAYFVTSAPVMSGPVTYGYDPAGVPVAVPAPKTNLQRLHDRVEATCAKARLAA